MLAPDSMGTIRRTHAYILAPESRGAILLLFLSSLIATVESQHQDSCSRACAEEHCNSLGIRYGKFCGVGWTGCEGEKPCDALDSCCKEHDFCVEKNGMLHISCHEKFKKCMRKVQKAGKKGFSKKCPYEVAIPLMTQGMDMAIMFGQLGSPSDIRTH